jgi:hypothetical protein
MQMLTIQLPGTMPEKTMALNRSFYKKVACSIFIFLIIKKLFPIDRHGTFLAAYLLLIIFFTPGHF